MNAADLPPLPSFDAYFAALHDRPPFPWQRRLAAQVLAAPGDAERCGWPAVLDLPTGVGKTAVLDIALYCVAAAPERMPRRIVLVVDRRVVVDQGKERAIAILERLCRPASEPLSAIAERLRRLCTDAVADEGAPFRVAVMRGGMPRDNDWARRPDQVVVGVSTVDQLGSRLLFRGYGIGARSASIHAGLVGNDTLVFLDEVHLSEPFAETLAAISQHYREARAGLPRRFAVVQMSATARLSTAPAQAFCLAADDRADGTLVERLSARKRATLHAVKVAGEPPSRMTTLASRAVTEALGLRKTTGAGVVAIVLNRVDSARWAARRMCEECEEPGAEVLLLTGRMRPIDRDAQLARYRERLQTGRKRAAGAAPLFVVATQCIEAGADFDFDALVTECASLDALRQRFGRLDRLGKLRDSRAVIVARADQVADASEPDAVYGDALRETWQWLHEHAEDGVVDFGIDALSGRLAGGTPAQVLVPRASAPILLPAHLDAWVQTSEPLNVEPDVASWLHGVGRAAPEVRVVWRAGLRLARLAAPSDDDDDADDAAGGNPEIRDITDELAACRPSSLEAVSVPLGVARRWLEGRSAPQIADVPTEIPADEDDWRPGPVRGEPIRWLRWQGGTAQLGDTAQLRPGDVIIVGTTRDEAVSLGDDADRMVGGRDAARPTGGLFQDTFDPEAREPVLDVGDLAQLRARGLATLRLDRDALAVWGLHAYGDVPAPIEDESAAERIDRVRTWIDAALTETLPRDAACTKDDWQKLRAALRQRDIRVVEVNGKLIVTGRVVRDDGSVPEVDDATTEDDASSFQRREDTLEGHSDEVRKLARGFAQALGLSSALADDLGLAAWLHDVGKADPRFQAWLVGGSEVRAAALERPLAKSARAPEDARERRHARRRAGYPAGSRHELMSLAMIEGHDDALAAAHDRDLVLHLVASHHGWCRPFPPLIEDPDDVEISLAHGEQVLRGRSQHALARLDSGVAARFWRLVDHYGWWGLAWLEAVLRLADHRASEARARSGSSQPPRGGDA